MHMGQSPLARFGAEPQTRGYGGNMKNIFFPITEREKELPFYLTYIGETDCQDEVNRPEGYYCPQIILCSKGSGILKFDDREQIVDAGKVFFLPAGSPHAYYAQEEIWRTHYISFAGCAVEALLNHLGLTEIKVYPVDVGVMKNIFRRLMNTVISDRFYGGYSASAIVYEYIIEFNRQIVTAEIRSEDDSASLTPVLNYIDEHFSEVIELETLCEIIGITPQYLCRLFRKHLGMRPLEYVAKRRIQQAKVYLTEGNKSVKQIAFEVGYDSPSYFCSVFKRNEGISPTEYMRREM